MSATRIITGTPYYLSSFFVKMKNGAGKKSCKIYFCSTVAFAALWKSVCKDEKIRATIEKHNGEWVLVKLEIAKPK